MVLKVPTDTCARLIDVSSVGIQRFGSWVSLRSKNYLFNRSGGEHVVVVQKATSLPSAARKASLLATTIPPFSERWTTRLRMGCTLREELGKLSIA